MKIYVAGRPPNLALWGGSTERESQIAGKHLLRYIFKDAMCSRMMPSTVNAVVIRSSAYSKRIPVEFSDGTIFRRR